MKKFLTLLTVVATVFGLTTLLFAQSDTKTENRAKIRQFIFQRVSAKLNLNSDQQAKAKTILQNAENRVKPLVKELKSNREQIKTLGTDGVYNEAQASELASKQAEIGKKLFMEKEKTKAELFAILTTEQKATAVKMLDNLKTKAENFKGFGSGQILDKLLDSE